MNFNQLSLSALIAFSFVVASSPAIAQSSTDATAVDVQEAPELKLPEDLAAKANADPADGEEINDPDRKYQVIERRINGRLDRVTVLRSNGLDEVYENREVDSMFSKEADELGEVQNVRRWTLGTW